MMQGISLHNLRRIAVPEGDVMHALKKTDIDFFGFGEVYISQINKGAIKGWKKHREYTLNIIVPVGEIKFVFFDDRKNSITHGQFYEIVLGQSNYQRLTVLPNLWMAFKGMSEGVSMLLNIISEPHNPLEADKKSLEEIKYTF